jgi:hypothetical protein
LEIPRKLPELALSGGLVCRKRKLKNFIDPETAGGCGVVPFLSVKYFFCQHVEPSVLRCAFDPIEVSRVVSEHCNAYSVRSVPPVNWHKKTRIVRVSGILNLYQLI